MTFIARFRVRALPLETATSTARTRMHADAANACGRREGADAFFVPRWPAPGKPQTAAVVNGSNRSAAIRCIRAFFARSCGANPQHQRPSGGEQSRTDFQVSGTESAKLLRETPVVGAILRVPRDTSLCQNAVGPESLRALDQDPRGERRANAARRRPHLDRERPIEWRPVGQRHFRAGTQA